MPIGLGLGLSIVLGGGTGNGPPASGNAGARSLYWFLPYIGDES